MISKIGPRAISLGLALLLIIVAIGRIASTYGVFVQTTDEPAHIAAGLEWLDNGTYTYEPHHPPLARIISALGPYIDGARLTPEQKRYIDNVPEDFGKRYRWRWYFHNLRVAMWDTGEQLLYGSDAYWRTLSLARAGNLIFFFFAAVLVWHWARRLLGNLGGALGAAVFVSVPPVLGHAGLATTDMAVACTFTFTIIAFCYWLNRPSSLSAIVFGTAGALAIASKFSALLYFPVCAGLLLAWRWYILRMKATRERSPSVGFGKWSGSFATAALSAAVLLWATYLFSIGPIKTESTRPHEIVDAIVGSTGPVHDFAYGVVEAPIVPAPQLFVGILQVAQHNKRGHSSYLLGDVRTTGWWYFFPIVLAVKTPIPVLLLGVLGVVLSIVRSAKEAQWELAAPALCVVGIMAAAMSSNINIGVRHILPLYPFLAICAGYGLTRLWTATWARPAKRSAAVILVGWYLVNTAMAHPDYLAYFNEFAVRAPEEVVIDSDLDWGQDLGRLADHLKKNGITEVSLAYQGTADPHRHNLPSFRVLRPGERSTGWVAASIFKLRVREDHPWLEEYEPRATIGKSIRLYYIPDSTE